jgi:hypothetical protein
MQYRYRGDESASSLVQGVTLYGGTLEIQSRLGDWVSPELSDRLQIRELLENWVVWRDAGDWERFAELWHPDGHMIATWFQASATDFVARCKQARQQGLKGLHSLGGSSIDVCGSRAIAQTKMQIMQRAEMEGSAVDVICCGRFWDALEKLDGDWRLRLRQPIYELDHIIPMDPTKPPVLDAELLASFPEGYRHLAYLQVRLGFDVHRTMPGTQGPEVEALRDRGRRWLQGDPPSCLLPA